MNLSPRDKNAIQAFLCLIIIAITAITMLYPDVIGYERSYKAIESKEMRVTNLHTNIIKNEDTIKSLSSNATKISVESEKMSIDADNLKNGINERDLMLHVPSILISLEEGARNNEIDVTIHYDQMKTHQAGQSVGENLTSGDKEVTEGEAVEGTEQPTGEEAVPPADEATDTPAEPVEPVEPGDDIDVENDEVAQAAVPDKPYIPDVGDRPERNEIEATEGEGTQTGGEGTEGEQTTGNTNQDRPTIPGDAQSLKEGIEGVAITTIPITINGDFVMLREFLKLIDTIDFIEPNYVEMTSDGPSVEGYVLLHIYHGEVK